MVPAAVEIGIGPSSAASFSFSSSTIRSAVFLPMPGIGKRTAERIIVELREKVGAEAGDPTGPIVAARTDDPRRLARDGLLELGFPPAEAEALLADAAGASAEELMAAALRSARR